MNNEQKKELEKLIGKIAGKFNHFADEQLTLLEAGDKENAEKARSRATFYEAQLDAIEQMLDVLGLDCEYTGTGAHIVKSK